MKILPTACIFSSLLLNCCLSQHVLVMSRLFSLLHFVLFVSFHLSQLISTVMLINCNVSTPFVFFKYFYLTKYIHNLAVYRKNEKLLLKKTLRLTLTRQKKALLHVQLSIPSQKFQFIMSNECSNIHTDTKTGPFFQQAHALTFSNKQLSRAPKELADGS